MSVVSIIGPSCSGKTTTVLGITGIYQKYIERPEHNPYLESVTLNAPNASHFKSQEWFLHEMKKWVEGADRKQTIILDQSPTGIFCVYSQYFHSFGAISKSEMEKLSRVKVSIEEMLKGWQSKPVVIALDADPDVLADRFRKREGLTRPVNMTFLKEIRGRFLEVFPDSGAAKRINTSNLKKASLLSLVSDYLQSKGIIPP